MTNAITHHPSDETLAAYASGTLDEARSLVVSIHRSLCAACGHAVDQYEAIGGALLEQASPVSMRPGALQAALGSIGTSAQGAEIASEQPLDRHKLGPWRRVWPGLQQRAVSVAGDSDIKVFMLKAAPGITLPHHKHTGDEWTCVLEGAFEHQFGRYGPGDFDEADETVDHKPRICSDVPCVCIVALQGSIRLQSFLGRLIQPILRL
ncbi:ChrR family anti-sigma-E factor [Mesorhizobium erdmanii]|uniref:Anti-sigma factor n=1 Tax=Mesorhizobium erdmanii TaxID=1777866 RepID=A0A6M7UJZ3_9HYPH|nr:MULTISPECIES: ChrR family anti-sigma-E factor [Mesorhizobium]OBQ74983.1 anti-sigma factor [Mesorhizobium loti]QKC77142.1 anti-sigma factor [Mesorhizobium erdmanii]